MQVRCPHRYTIGPGITPRNCVWIFPVCQVLEAAPALAGVTVIRLLLCDIFWRNDNIPYAGMKDEKPPGRLIGSMQVEQFCEDLATKKSFPAPFTFGRARDVKDILVQGFLSEKLKFFPAVKFRDIHGSHRLTWNCKDYVVLESEGAPAKLGEIASATLKVCTEIERWSLSYSRHLGKYQDHGMPWMEKVLERLPSSMKGQLQVNVLTFVSCLGMLMNGDYVDFNHLASVLQDMSPHVSQAMLQK